MAISFRIFSLVACSSAGSNSPRGERASVVPEVSTIECDAHVGGKETLAASLKEGLSTINPV